MSMDLQQAYDRLPRHHLAEGLALCGCPPNIQTVLLQWLFEAQYHLRHRGLSQGVAPSRGVRQGCKASPLEWTAFLLLVCHHIGLQVSHQGPQAAFEWICNHLITYADDLLCKWWIRSASEFEQVVHQIGEIFDIKRPQFCVDWKARNEVTLQKVHSHTPRRQMVGGSSLQGQTWVKLVQQHVYLGAKLSFFALSNRHFSTVFTLAESPSFV